MRSGFRGICLLLPIFPSTTTPSSLPTPVLSRPSDHSGEHITILFQIPQWLLNTRPSSYDWPHPTFQPQLPFSLCPLCSRHAGFPTGAELAHCALPRTLHVSPPPPAQMALPQHLHRRFSPPGLWEAWPLAEETFPHHPHHTATSPICRLCFLFSRGPITLYSEAFLLYLLSCPQDGSSARDESPPSLDKAIIWAQLITQSHKQGMRSICQICKGSFYGGPLHRSFRQAAF